MLRNYKIEFNGMLNILYRRRLAKLHRSLFRKRGPCPKLTPTFLKKQIEKLQRAATRIVVKGGVKKALDEITEERRWNIMMKRERDSEAYSWAARIAPKSTPVIYSFWNHRKCLYVGRTSNLRERLRNHFKSIKRVKFKRVGNSIRIRIIRAQRELPRAECLAVALFEPSDNDRRPSNKKYARTCPLCKIHRNIEMELQSIFRSRRKRKQR